MSYANGTQFYNLPQTVGTDKRDWFDTNAAFAAVDAALHAAYTGQASDAEAIAVINGKLTDDEAAITSLQGSVSTHSSQITTLANSVNQLNTDVAAVKADALDMICAVDEGTAQVATVAVSEGNYFRYNDVLYIATDDIAIGDTIIPNTNCRATNVATELQNIEIVLPSIPKIAHGNTAVTAGESYDTFDINFTSAGFSSAPNITITPVSQFGDVTVSYTGITSSHAYGIVLPKTHASSLEWIAVEG